MPYLTRRRACRLQLQLMLASAVIPVSESGRLTVMVYCLTFDTPTNLEGPVTVSIFPRKRVAQLYSRALDPLFVASYESQGYGGGIRTRLCGGC
jgi:hypothetical protein